MNLCGELWQDSKGKSAMSGLGLSTPSEAYGVRRWKGTRARIRLRSGGEMTKGEMLQQVLDEYGGTYGLRTGWQSVSCINTDGHTNGDRNKSASASLELGEYTCFACDLRGDGIGLLMQLENISFKDALARLGGRDKVEEEATWLTW